MASSNAFCCARNIASILLKSHPKVRISRINSGMKRTEGYEITKADTVTLPRLPESLGRQLELRPSLAADLGVAQLPL